MKFDQVVVALRLVGDREPAEVVGDLSVCADGMQVDPELLTNGDASSRKHRGREREQLRNGVGTRGSSRCLCHKLPVWPLQESSLLESRRAAAVCCVAAEGRFSPAEIPEPTPAENVLRHGVFSGATLQLLCALAVIVPVSRCHKPDSHSLGIETWETVKKPKASAAQLKEESRERKQKEPIRA
uniref:Uncharacterized protein n=1 Tax=Meleagris gallopavo TaxID=9103 RepID=A0A803XYH4_MELGA